MCALLVAGSAALSWAAFLAIAAFGMMCPVLIDGLRAARLPDDSRESVASSVSDEHRMPDARAVTAKQLARSLDVPGRRVAKPVMVRADGDVWMAVLPASERIDFHAVRDTLRARTIELLPEAESSSRTTSSSVWNTR